MQETYSRSEAKTIMYRTVISFREEDARQLNLINNRKAWEDFMSTHALKFAEANHIPISTFEWVGAVHMEKGHPHMHVCYWNREQPEIKDDFVKPTVLDKARKKIMKEVFADELALLFVDKNAARDELRECSSAFFREFSEILQSSDNIMMHNNMASIMAKVSQKKLEMLAEELLALKDILPTKGRLHYGLMPLDTKHAVDQFTLRTLMTSKDLASAFESYIHSNVELTKFYTSYESGLATIREKAKKEALKMLGNQILKMLKQFDNADFEMRSKTHQNSTVQDLLDSLFALLNTETNRNNTKLSNTGELSKQARKELAKELESNGIDWN